jgi:hypothetical protein
LLRLGNLNSATAVGSGLAKADYQPAIRTALWDLINPNDDFAAAEAHVIKAPLPILPYLRPSVYTLEQVPSIFRPVWYPVQRQGAGVGQGASESWYRVMIWRSICNCRCQLLIDIHPPPRLNPPALQIN